MPFGISESQPDCTGFATVKQEADGSFTTIGCHTTKQDAVDQMVVVSLSEDIDPLGQVDTPEQERIEKRAPSLVAPQFMAASAERGLRLHEQGLSGDGLMPATVAQARQMANGEALSEDKWRKIPAWIARHIGDLDAVQGDEITAGLVAMLLWGGGSTKTSARRTQEYAERIVAQLDADEERAPVAGADKFSTEQEAADRAEEIGCVGTHSMNENGQTVFMPCASHAKYDSITGGGDSYADEERAPAPKKDQIKGSDKNPAGSAADSTGGIKLSEATEKSLQTKADEHNADMAAKDRPNWTRVRVSTLRAVYRRGSGAFSTSHRPNISRAAWSMARVNAFLYLVRTGKPQNPKYITDNDLLHADHPKKSNRHIDTDSSVMMASTMTDLIEERWCVTGADEKRIAYTTLDLRQAPNGTTLFGYAALFDSPSEPMPFIEYVRRGAFSKTLNDGADVRLLIDHEGVPLARTRSGTMRLVEDERGLAVEADLDPMNPDAARVISAMSRGDLSQMSFAFRTIKDQFSDDRMVRELREVQLYDVSVVTFPAYEQTVAEIRSRLLQTEETQPTLTATSTSVSVRRAQLALARHSK